MCIRDRLTTTAIGETMSAATTMMAVITAVVNVLFLIVLMNKKITPNDCFLQIYDYTVHKMNINELTRMENGIFGGSF